MPMLEMDVDLSLVVIETRGSLVAGYDVVLRLASHKLDVSVCVRLQKT